MTAAAVGKRFNSDYTIALQEHAPRTAEWIIDSVNMSTESRQVSGASGRSKRRGTDADEDGRPNGSEDMAAQPKRQRVSRACDSCRSKKDKCDGLQPVCSTCESLCRPCTYKANPKKRGLPTGYIRSLELLWGLVFQKIRGSEDVMRALLRSVNLPSHLATMGKEAEGSDTLLSSFKNSTMLKDLERLLVILEQPEEERERNLRLYNDGDTSLDIDGILVSSEAQEWQIPEGLEHREIPLPVGVSPSRPSMISSVPRPGTYRTKECGVQTMAIDESRTQPLVVNPTAADLRMTPTSAPLQLPYNAWPLLDIYFSYTQCWFPILEKHDILRTAFQYTEGDVHISHTVPGSGDHAALWAALTLASLQDASIRAARDSGAQSHQNLSPLQLYNIARGLIPTEHGLYELGHVQALLILSLVKFGQQEWTAAWILVGHAVRIAQVLGLNQPSSPSSSSRPPEQSNRLGRAKHVFLGCFVLETLIAERTSQCPSLRRDDLSRVGPINEDGLEEWHPWEDQTDLRSTQASRTSMQRGPLQALSTFNRLVSLVSILNEVCCSKHDSSVSRSQLETFELQLQRWASALPKSFRIDLQSQPPKLGSPHIFALEMTYWSIVSAVSQQITSRENYQNAPEISHKSRAMESSRRSLQLLQAYLETYSSSATVPTFGMILGYCLPRKSSPESASDLELGLQDQISSYSSHLARTWSMQDQPTTGQNAGQRDQGTIATPAGFHMPESRANNNLSVQHALPTSTRPSISHDHISPNTAQHPPTSDSFLSTPWIRATQNLDHGASVLPTPDPSLTARGGASEISGHPGSMNTVMNSGLRQSTSAANVIPNLTSPFPSDGQYPPTYQDPSLGLGAFVDMDGYGQPRRQQRIAPDLDALFDELASLDGAEKYVLALTLRVIGLTADASLGRTIYPSSCKIWASCQIRACPRLTRSRARLNPSFWRRHSNYRALGLRLSFEGSRNRSTCRTHQIDDIDSRTSLLKTYSHEQSFCVAAGRQMNVCEDPDHLRWPIPVLAAHISAEARYRFIRTPESIKTCTAWTCARLQRRNTLPDLTNPWKLSPGIQASYGSRCYHARPETMYSLQRAMRRTERSIPITQSSMYNNYIHESLIPISCSNLQSRLLQLLKIQRHMLNSNLIPIHPKAHNNPSGLITKVRMMSPRLPSVHIAHMQLNERDPHAEQRIANRNGGMRIRAGVDHDAVDIAAGGLDAVDDCAFVVGLEGVEGAVVGCGEGCAGRLDVCEGGAAVDVGFAGAQEVEIGAVDEED